MAGGNETKDDLGYSKPEVEHIINDHAGTVLDEPEPAPSLTRSEEKRVIQIYYDVVEEYVQYLYNKAKGILDEDDVQPQEDTPKTMKVPPTPSGESEKGLEPDDNEEHGGGDEGGGGEEGGEETDENGEGGEEGDENCEEGKEVDVEIDEEALRASHAAAAKAAQEEENRILNEARNQADKGITIPYIRKSLGYLDMNLNDNQFEEHVEGYFKQMELDKDVDGLDLEGFVGLVSTVYAPGHKFGARLRKACSRADDKRVNDLIGRGCNPLGYDGGGFTSLHYAAQSGHVSTCEYLLAYAQNPPASFVQLLPHHHIMQAPPSPTGSEKSTDSNEGGKRENEGKKGPYYRSMLEAIDNSGWTPLMVASSRGEVAVMTFLIGCGADVLAYSKDSKGDIGRTALHWAAAKGKVEAVGLLLRSGADVNCIDASGWTPLHCALMHGHVATATALINKHKADKVCPCVCFCFCFFISLLFLQTTRN
mmetsp:Transcript_37040/g.47864  ORF Transcript_37040/g.47864 Transcript_37040/m.47864 type:complete len:479 (+) Transcript_37040:100-1536(+)